MKFFNYFFILLFLASCASREPTLIVDPASVKDSDKVVQDREECFQIAANIDMSDEAVAKGVGGVLLGGGAVAGAAALAYGAVFAPAIPFIIAGGAAGGDFGELPPQKKKKQLKTGFLKSAWKIEATEYILANSYKVYFNTLQTIDFIEVLDNVTMEWNKA